MVFVQDEVLMTGYRLFLKVSIESRSMCWMRISRNVAWSIDHKKLLIKLNVSGQMRRAIKGWLKAGIMDGEELFPSEEGTPQGGVISPFVTNNALLCLERAIANR